MRVERVEEGGGRGAMGAVQHPVAVEVCQLGLCVSPPHCPAHSHVGTPRKGQTHDSLLMGFSGEIQITSNEVLRSIFKFYYFHKHPFCSVQVFLIRG